MRFFRHINRGNRLPSSRTARLALLVACALGMLTFAAATARDSGHSAPATPGASEHTPALARTDGAEAHAAGEEALKAEESEEGAVPNVTATVPESAIDRDRFVLPLAAWQKVTDRFGAPRGGGLIHGGIDLAIDADNHAPVLAACAGSVASIGTSGVYGNHVFLDCGDGWSALFAHLSKLLVREGQAVEKAAVLGISGTSGFSTGEHLHFEIRYRDTPVNPEEYLDFHIAPGTPLSDGPIFFWKPGAPTSTPQPEDVPATPTTKPTATPVAPTSTPTPTPTATPTPRTPKKTATPPPISR